MSHRFVLAAALFLAGCVVPGSAQPLRSGDGHPSLEGNWNSASLTPFERPVELGAKAFYTEQEATAYERKRVQVLNRDRRDGSKEEDLSRSYNELFLDRGTRLAPTRRTSMIIDPEDGRIPPMTPEAARKFQAIQARMAEHGFDGPKERPLPDRCLMFSQSGPPMIPGNYNNNYQIVQTADYLMILAEMGNQVRVIPLDGRPNPPANLEQWMGVSRGHWEENTLVVETTNFRFNDRSRFGVQYNGMTDGNLKIIERFTRNEADSIVYRATIDDPTVYTRPWTMEAVLEKTGEPIYEYACHEGNYAMSDVLAGARAQEKSEAKKP